MTNNLESLIATANAEGWAVVLAQQPVYWEAKLQRRLSEVIDGIINELAFGTGDSPVKALEYALYFARTDPMPVRPQGSYNTTVRTPLDLSAYLNLPPAAPITRRRL